MRSPNNPWLNRFAWLVAATTWLLIGMGGLVTSHEAGLAVPDWPTTYGYNMFLFPIRLWRGGIFYEHTHRLAASGVGLLTMVLAAWLWARDCRKWARWLGVGAFVVVVLQGILGGIRVTLLENQIGIVHAALAQLFFCLVTAIALLTSSWWEKLVTDGVSAIREAAWLRHLILLVALLVFGQLVLGATMRHQHAGLAVPDFPLAYGKLWPSTDPATIATVNQNRLDDVGYQPITAVQIYLHMAHRLVAGLLVVAIGCAVWLLRRATATTARTLRQLSLLWFSLTVLQFILGALTVWSHKAADVATAHVMVGALILVVGCQLTIILFRAQRVAVSHFVDGAIPEEATSAWLQQSPSPQSAATS